MIITRKNDKRKIMPGDVISATIYNSFETFAIVLDSDTIFDLINNEVVPLKEAEEIEYRDSAELII